MYTTYKKILIPETKESVGTGWLPPLPDLRDYNDEEPAIANIAKKLGFSSSVKKVKALPLSVNLRNWCSPVENQLSIGSCTAHACVGVVEYFQRRAFIFCICGGG